MNYKNRSHIYSNQIISNQIHAGSLIQCDEIFTAVITKRCAEILSNGIFFYQTRANPLFEISGIIQSM